MNYGSSHLEQDSEGAHPSREAQAESEVEMRENWPFVSEILMQPPSFVRPLQVFPSPVVLAVRLNDKRDNQSTGGGHWNTSGIFVTAQLTMANNTEAWIGDELNVLQGQSARSIKLARTRPNVADPTIGYVVFPNLAIPERGEYVLRIAFFDMDSNGSQWGAPLQSVRKGPVLYSDVIQVFPEAVSVPPGKPESEDLPRTELLTGMLDSRNARILTHLESEGVLD